MTREERILKKEKQELELKKKEKKKKRLVSLLKIGIFLIFFTFSLLLYSRFIATSGLVVREYKIESNILPKEFHGFKIIQFTDLHYGSTVDENSLKNIVDKINQLKPDIITFTGDLIDKDATLSEEELSQLNNLLNEMTATVGKYAVSGNHDYTYDNYSEILENSNFKYLDNTYDLIYYQGYSPVLITGISDTIKGKNDINQAFSYFNQEGNDNNIYTITLLHEPDTIKEILENYKVDLALAGHSHNGQVRLPFLPPLVTIKGAKIYNDEFYQIDSTKLYISGGLGTSNYKYRLFNRPSINFFRFNAT